MLASFEYMRARGLLLNDVSLVFQLALMYPVASWGSMAPDLDHPIALVKERTPVNTAINKIINLKPLKHRSRATHTIGTTAILALFAFVFVEMFAAGTLPSFEVVVLRLWVMGTFIGVFSHIFLDLLTMDGVYLLPWESKKVRLVPRIKMFATDTAWERFIRSFLYVGCVAIVCWWIWLYVGGNADFVNNMLGGFRR